MNIHHCDFCGAVSIFIAPHGSLICFDCRPENPDDETDGQDLFDDDADFVYHEVSYSLH